MAGHDRPEEKEAIRTTIVGGRPPGCGQDIGAIPRGLEVLVKKAAVDPAFRKLLLERRAEAAATIGLKLEPAEALMLAAVPAAQLEAIIARTKVAEQHRRVFLGTAAAAMLAVVGGVALTGCGERPGPPTGIAPDRPRPQPQDQPSRTKGIEPDRPERLDIKGERPDRPPATKGGEPDTPGEAPKAETKAEGTEPARPAGQPDTAAGPAQSGNAGGAPQQPQATIMCIAGTMPQRDPFDLTKAERAKKAKADDRPTMTQGPGDKP